jgi:hypothetical protein
MAGRPIARLVRDDGERFARGDRVQLHRTRSTPPEWHAAKDPRGPYEVMGCSPVPSGSRRLLQLVLRVLDPT